MSILSLKHVITGSLLLISYCTFHLEAQQNPGSIAPQEMKQLLADQVKINKEKLRLDSLAMAGDLEEEAEDIFWANDLYDNTWNSTFVNPYGKSVQIPDSVRIDCSEWAIPAVGHITSKFGPRRKRYHYGIDLKVQTGDPIYSTFDGKVRIVATAKGGYGKYIVIRHNNGLETVYGHLSGFNVERDQVVRAGDLIGYGGNTGRSTGSHLHFETRLLGVPINPSEIFDFQNQVAHRDVYTFYANKGRSSATPYGTSFAQSKQAVKHSETSKMATHKVRSGDTLGAIARKYGTSVKHLCELNKITTTTTLRLGQVLRTS